MSVRFSDHDLTFAEEVRAFILANRSASIRDKVASELRLTRPEMTAWQQALYHRGWAAPAWPKAYGGTGWSVSRQYLFKREIGLNYAPDLPPFGLQMIGPVLYTFGSEALKARYLPGILTGETWWCQGFSEPNAGSDLASLKTLAADRGDYYELTGQKIWTSLAQFADLIFCLARTAETPKRQDGISMLIVDMRSPGVTVRPIITLDEHHHLNEVFFDSVRVPKENLIGEAGKGWTYAKFILGHERLGIANIPRLRRRMEALHRIGCVANRDGRIMWENVEFRHKVAALEVDLVALEETELRALRRAEAGVRDGPEASILKVAGTEILQRADALLAETIGSEAALLPADSMRVGDFDAIRYGILPALLHGRAASIYGGTNEIQRGIIARLALRAGGGL
jgi:alkylation response protein AidB-like acyl-CoA dehydrogenase